MLQRFAMTRHAGTAHHDGVGSVFLLKSAADFDHFRQRSFARGGLRHAHVERAFSGQPFHKFHLPEIADMAAYRALRDRNDAESLRARQRCQYAAFGDAENRTIRSFAADMQTRIAIAGNDKGRRAVITLDKAP